ncbi:MAG: methyltransferase domain-containing protein [Candidatus Wallbacteria bacterium]
MQKRQDTIIDPDIKIIQTEDSFCYSTDTLLLYEFISEVFDFSKPAKVLELGAGTGGLCIVLAKKYPDSKVFGIEIQPHLIELANESASLNRIDNVNFMCGDIRKVKGNYYPEYYNLIVTNPPYFKLGTGRINKNSKKAQAKHEIKCTLSDIFEAASFSIKKTGTFCLIQHYSRFYDVINEAAKNGFELICMRPVYLTQNQPANATHCLFAFGKNHKKEPQIMPPKYIR